METTTLLADPEHASGRLKQGSDAVSGQAILFIIDTGDNLRIRVRLRSEQAEPPVCADPQTPFPIL
jgi:hypothetical protein